LYLFLGDLPLEGASGVNEMKLGTPFFFPVNPLDQEGLHTDESEMHVQESPSNPLLQGDACDPVTWARHPTPETFSQDTLPT